LSAALPDELGGNFAVPLCLYGTRVRIVVNLHVVLAVASALVDLFTRTLDQPLESRGPAIAGNDRAELALYIE
jgi:hypothetical protein